MSANCKLQALDASRRLLTQVQAHLFMLQSALHHYGGSCPADICFAHAYAFVRGVCFLSIVFHSVSRVDPTTDAHTTQPLTLAHCVPTAQHCNKSLSADAVNLQLLLLGSVQLVTTHPSHHMRGSLNAELDFMPLCPHSRPTTAPGLAGYSCPSPLPVPDLPVPAAGSKLRCYTLPRSLISMARLSVANNMMLARSRGWLEQMATVAR